MNTANTQTALGAAFYALSQELERLPASPAATALITQLSELRTNTQRVLDAAEGAQQ